MSSYSENTPRELVQVWKYIWKYVFINKSGAFTDFRYFFIFFFGNFRFNVWFQFLQIKEKSIFSASEGGK